MGIIQRAKDAVRTINGLLDIGKSYTVVPSQWRKLSPQQRRIQYDLAITMYSGLQLPILAADIGEAFSTRAARQLMLQPITFNILAKVIDALAMLYKVEPSWECKSNPALIESFGGDFVATLKQADRLSELCGLCFVGVGWNEKKECLTHTVVPPDQCEVVWNPYNPDIIDAMSIFSWATGSHGEDMRYRVSWTPEEYGVFLNDNDITEEYLDAFRVETGRANTYGVVPFATMRPRTPLVGDLWGTFREDLLWVNRTLNMKLCELSMLLKYQAGSQLVIRGDLGTKGDIFVGTGVPLIIPQGGDGSATGAEFITPGARITEMWDTIRELLQMAAYIAHLGGQWALDGRPKESGIAQQVANQDLDEYRKDKEDSHNQFFSVYAPIMAKVAQAGGNIGTGTADDFKVEYGESRPFTDPKAEADTWVIKIQNNVARPEDWAMDLNPKLTTDADAKKFIDDNAARMAEIQKIGRPAPPDPSAFLGGAKGGGLDGAGVNNAPATSGDMAGMTAEEMAAEMAKKAKGGGDVPSQFKKKPKGA